MWMKLKPLNKINLENGPKSCDRRYALPKSKNEVTSRFIFAGTVKKLDLTVVREVRLTPITIEKVDFFTC